MTKKRKAQKSGTRIYLYYEFPPREQASEFY